MGIPDTSILDLIEKVRSWIFWGNFESSSISCGLEMTDNKNTMCCNCKGHLSNSDLNCHCKSCEQQLCGNCIMGLSSLNEVTNSHLKETSCQSCGKLSQRSQIPKICNSKVHPSESTRQSPEPPSPSFRGLEVDGDSPHGLTRSVDLSFSNHSSPLSVSRSPSGADEQESEDSASHFYGTSSEYFCDTSGVGSSSVSTRHKFFSFISVGSSPSDCPSRIHITSDRVGHHVQQGQGETLEYQIDSPFDQEHAILETPAKGNQDAIKTDDTPALQIASGKQTTPLGFDYNGLIWLPPPPDVDSNDGETDFFTYENEDDEVGDSGAMFLPSADLDSMLLEKEKQILDHKEAFRGVVQEHFRTLVSQLLQGQDIVSVNEISAEKWLDIITTLAWDVAKFIKPDTYRGGSMDPCDYVKVKCVASGSPSDSKVIKGVVCTKNIKHKRMTSEYKKTRVLVLGGALEYQRVPNQLASFNTLLQQEKDHLKMIVSKIEAHRPNVLVVEKSVSSFAQEQLLAKDISLVLNVKRQVLERIARCTGAFITPSTDHISTTRLGHCELFHLEKVLEEHEPANQLNKKPSKTLMLFEGCPRRLGCTVVLRGLGRRELKKLKHVVQYAIFAAYHLSLETSFFADEGASLPKIEDKHCQFDHEKSIIDKTISMIPDSVVTTSDKEEIDVPDNDTESAEIKLELGLQESLSELYDTCYDDVSMPTEFRCRNALSEACDKNLALDEKLDDTSPTRPSSETHAPIGSLGQLERAYDLEASSELYSANEVNQSIVLSFSSHSMLHGTVCERSRLLRIKFYGPSDKPLGRYLRDDLFDRSSICGLCKESAEAHVICYTHQNGNLTINVKYLPSVKLPREHDGKIWMWHRCLECAHGGVPPVTQRVVMSDAAWGLSFGKFLELSFSNHTTGNRVASCGHSLQRDCLRFFGFGSMVAFFRYSPINIFSVHLPPPTLEFSAGEQSWIRKEASELLSKTEILYADISRVLQKIENESLLFAQKCYDTSELQNHVFELKNKLADEQGYYRDLLQLADNDILDHDQVPFDVLEISRLRHSILVGSQVWDHRLCQLESLFKENFSVKTLKDCVPNVETNGSGLVDDIGREDIVSHYPKVEECSITGEPCNVEESNHSPCYEGKSCGVTTFSCNNKNGVQIDEQDEINITTSDCCPPSGSTLSDKIDSAWSGADIVDRDISESVSAAVMHIKDSPSFKRLISPKRVYSFDSVQRLQERMRNRSLPSSLHLSHIRSFHASGDYRHMLRDPILNVQRSCSQVFLHDTEKLNLVSASQNSFISSASLLPTGARLVVPKNFQDDLVFTIYDDEPTSIISYALSSKEYENWISYKPIEGGSNTSPRNKMPSLASDLSAWQSFGSLDLEYMHYGNYSSEDISMTAGTPSAYHRSSHLRISFEDEHLNAAGKVKFSVTCYFAKEFDDLRRKCCPNALDLISSLSRCRKWSAQGGKSNVYFAKSCDDRFIIKQVTKTELESFNEFSSEYFNYSSEALSSGSPTCLAKILGIYQVLVKHLKGGKEMKMDLMIMENLFFRRNISKVYDLKGSLRSRYNSDPSGMNNVLLDMNLLEAMRTDPIFLGSKAKRSLERAVWNDTSFLASIDVMDYSLLVGIDDEKKELVLGIIDFMRQYTWDKHLETWVKATGILGGPKNASPTIISPKQYKKRFRKAMTNYFRTVPEQWSA